jgi:anti-sigma B factor antagonist
VERSSGAAPPRQLLAVEVEGAEGEQSIVSLAGELDLSTMPQLERPLSEQLESHFAVIVDLTALSFIDSSGIGLLISAFRANEGKLHTVIAEGSQVERVFRLAGIDQALPLYLSRADALRALGSNGTV